MGSDYPVKLLPPPYPKTKTEAKLNLKRVWRKIFSTEKAGST